MKCFPSSLIIIIIENAWFKNTFSFHIVDACGNVDEPSGSSGSSTPHTMNISVGNGETNCSTSATNIGACVDEQNQSTNSK